jgi:type I restriction enzyme M protein
MHTHSQQIVQRLWSYCNVLRDDGVSYSDYLEQLTYLLFLKMAYERTKPPYNELSAIEKGYDWGSLLACKEDEIEEHYRRILHKLGEQQGMLGLIFRRAANKIQNPAHLRRLIVDLIDRQSWMAFTPDVQGDAYEGLLQKNAEDTKSGAGQYFTPRALIEAIIEVMRPAPGQRICDPACGSGGFLLAAYEYIVKRYTIDKEQQQFLRIDALRGWEIVDTTARLCTMNLFLHGIGSDEKGKEPVHVTDSLRQHPGEYFDMVLTNPPFGRKSSVTFVNGKGREQRESNVVARSDFWASTSNKQLNFVQHVKSLLNENGRAAIVVPDNVLFEGGAGETIRRRLLDECDVHTLLRLPTGIFYAQGVKANVLFFDRKADSTRPCTEKVWVYDLRTNQNFTLRTNPLTRKHLDDFAACYHPEDRLQRQESERFHSFSYEDLLKRDKLSLDLFWLRDKSLEEIDNLPPPDVIIGEIIEDLQTAIEQLTTIAEDLGNRRARKARKMMDREHYDAISGGDSPA